MTTRIDETCQCGASVSVTGGDYRNDKHAPNPRGAEEIVERWRADHKHVEPAAPTSCEQDPKMTTGDNADCIDLMTLAERARDKGGRVCISPDAAERIAEQLSLTQVKAAAQKAVEAADAYSRDVPYPVRSSVERLRGRAMEAALRLLVARIEDVGR